MSTGVSATRFLGSIMEDHIYSVGRLAVQLVKGYHFKNTNPDDSSSTLSAQPFYALSNVLSDPGPVESKTFALACCWCTRAISGVKNTDRKARPMDPVQYAEACFSGDKSESLQNILYMLGSECDMTSQIPRLSKSDAEIIAKVRDGLWDSRGETFKTEAALVRATLMPENHPWRNLVCHYMGSPPLGLYPTLPTVHHMKKQHLDGAIFGVAVPQQPLLSLLCSASPCRPGSGMIHQDIVAAPTSTTENVMELASADVAAGIFSSEALERNRLGCLGPGWVEGSGAVHCCCHKCDGTAIGCKRRSIKHITQMVYCAGDQASQEIVPLTGFLWRVAWKAHAFDPQKQSQAFFNHTEEAIVIQSVVRDIANTREKTNGIIQLADSWVHLDVCDETIGQIAKFCRHRLPNRGELSGAKGVIFPNGMGINQANGAALAAVVMGTIRAINKSPEYEVICAGLGSFLYTEAEIRGMLVSPGGSDEGAMSLDVFE